MSWEVSRVCERLPGVPAPVLSGGLGFLWKAMGLVFWTLQEGSSTLTHNVCEVLGLSRAFREQGAAWGELCRIKVEPC